MAIRMLIASEPYPPGGGPNGTVGSLQRLCRALVRALPADGASMSVMAGDGVRGVVAASAPAWESLDLLQFTLGEGPCIEAFTARRPVLESGLSATSGNRWPASWAVFRERAVSAAFAFPLQVGAARLGTLGVYRTAPGTLSETALAQALTFSEVAVELLLDGQERALSGTVDAGLEAVLDSQYVVYQAQGMIMVDLGVSLPDAMARLQAHAYAHDTPLHKVAREVVAGRLHLEPDGP